jgi:hypothetical protein
MPNKAQVAAGFTRDQIKELVERLTALGGYL